MARVIKITETSNTRLPSSYRYARKRMRVVECEEHQNGWRSEKGVLVLWESDHYAANSRGPRSRYAEILREAEDIAEVAEEELGAEEALRASIAHDYSEEYGTAPQWA